MLVLRAFLLGFFEHLRPNEDWGRTWRENQDANEAYDRGWNLADLLCGRWK